VSTPSGPPPALPDKSVGGTPAIAPSPAIQHKSDSTTVPDKTPTLPNNPIPRSTPTLTPAGGAMGGFALLGMW
jgi:hypothetical protein